MVEVASHLAPEDGVSDAIIRFEGLDACGPSGGAEIRFALFQDVDRVGAFRFYIQPEDLDSRRRGSIDSLVAEAARQMRDALRQMLFQANVFCDALEKRTASDRP